jgi:protein-L-isoaspartate(D-aspartate) O-methyltransferase
MEPMVLARLVQLANIRPGDKVLHVGCATGYATAILANLAREVVAIDEDAELTEMAGKLLVVQDIRNARVIQALHALGAMAEAPFDVILIEGQVPATPAALLHQLADGGRLVAVVGERAMASAMLYTRHGEATSTRAAFDAAVKRLPGFVVERPAFVF